MHVSTDQTGFEPRIFGSRERQSLGDDPRFTRWSHTRDLTVGTPGVERSLLRLVGLESVYCYRVRKQVSRAAFGWTRAVLGVLYACVLYFVFALVQRS